MIKVIRQSYDIWGECPVDFEESLRWIEKAGRVCWQSQDKITDKSYAEFIRKICDKEHSAVIEQSNLVLLMNQRHADLDDSKFIHHREYGPGEMYAGNYRAFMEASGFKSVNDLSVYLPYQVTKNIPNWAKAVTVKLVTDRRVTHEIVRHRPCSFLQLSQRYVDHRKQMEFILPCQYYGKQEHNPKYDKWYGAMEMAAAYYWDLREYEESPQEARSVLPNSMMTEIVITAYLPEWEHIFNLRCSKAAEPMMRDIMIPLRQEFADRGWVKG